jgi:type 1 glutamine amidotransferase
MIRPLDGFFRLVPRSIAKSLGAWRLALGGWSLALGILACASASRADDEAGFKPLFNGTDLSGWDGNPKFWSVEGGVVTGRTTKENPTDGNTFLIWRQGEVDDFEIRASFRIVGGNSGIQYRSAEKGKWIIGGYQGDFEAGETYSGILYEERGTRGIMAERGQQVKFSPDGTKQVVKTLAPSAELQSLIKKEDWNEYRIIAVGSHLVHQINGATFVDVVDEQTKVAARSGLLALQLHAGPPMTVQFKDVRLKRLKAEGAKRLVLVAGHPSHAKGDHEFNAGVKILRRCLNETSGVIAASYHNGWPQDPTAFDGADAVLLYMDGGSGHPLIEPSHIAQMDALIRDGVGLCCCHYAVEVPKEQGGPQLLEWIGGYYETGFSINPHWTADFKELPDHPVTRGVKPFAINDEWYYNMRFRTGAVQPLLVSTPPDDTRGTPAAKERAGQPEVVAWTTERPDGGRGFGFTGGHFHRNWAQDDFRKLVLNALVWSAKMEVPAEGVASAVTAEELAENLDPK